jgi:hypothetical protein
MIRSAENLAVITGSERPFQVPRLSDMAEQFLTCRAPVPFSSDGIVAVGETETAWRGWAVSLLQEGLDVQEAAGLPDERAADDEIPSRPPNAYVSP